MTAKNKPAPVVLVAEDDDTPVTLPDGTVLDGDVAEQYAEQVIARVRARNLIPGGKSLSAPGRHSPVVQARVPEELHERLTAEAAARGVSVSRLAREALEHYLAS